MKDDVQQLAGLLSESPEQTASIQEDSDKLAADYDALKDRIDAKQKVCNNATHRTVFVLSAA